MSNLFDPPPRWREITTGEMMDCYQFETVPKGFAQQQVSLTRGEDEMDYFHPCDFLSRRRSDRIKREAFRAWIEFKLKQAKNPPLSLYSLGDE